jgi:hypothetical protein
MGEIMTLRKNEWRAESYFWRFLFTFLVAFGLGCFVGWSL